MRVLMISTDRNIFFQQSPAGKRMIEYGKLFDELHIVVFSHKKHFLEPTVLSSNVLVYPTNSSSKILYIADAIRISKKILSIIFFGVTVITTQDPFETAIAGIKLKNRFKFPLQIQLHTDLFSRSFYDGTILNWLRFQISKFTLPRASSIRVIREKIKQDIVTQIKFPNEKIVVLPIFVDIQKIKDYPITVNLKLKYRQFDEVILMASRLAPEKNIPLALKAFRKIVSQNPKLGLIIVGQGNEEMKIRAMIKKLGLGKNVIMEAWQQDLSSYYKTASLFINTSNFEGYGMTLIEAGSVGCPILTTNVGIAQDLFDDGRNALVCPVGDVKCFTNKIITFFNNPVIQKSMREEISSDIQKLIYKEEEYIQKQKESFEMLVPQSQKE
jgi:glycosyltransferase involved in cell wall biosynthesis